MFIDPFKPFTAEIPADTTNNLWPEFKVHFLPPVEFEVSDAMSEGSSGMMTLLRKKIKSWSGLKASVDAATFLNSHHGNLFKRRIEAGEDIPYHADLLPIIHSVCLSTIWRKIAGFMPLTNSSPATTPELQETTAKN